MKIGDHTAVSHFPPEVNSGIIKYMAKFDLTNTYAVQCLVIKALRNENFISKEVYDFYLQQFSRPVSAKESKFNKPHPMTYVDLKAQQKLDEMSRYFQGVLNQWSLHPSPEWRRKTLLVAQEWKDSIPAAKLVLDLGGGQMVLNVAVPQKQKELDP